jgi:hypothetical protein
MSAAAARSGGRNSATVSVRIPDNAMRAME